MGKTFKDSLSKRDKEFRYSANVRKPGCTKKSADKKMRYKRRYKCYEDTSEE